MQPIPIDERGRFSGYASVFDRLDQSGDLVMPGAFAKSLARRGAAKLRMLFQHDPKEPVDNWCNVLLRGWKALVCSGGLSDELEQLLLPVRTILNR